ncbi:MAG: SGNH/GDSL hydrolase family protein [Candidatus Hydrogenedentes bacterium]|nr:SGNH/GDSL hydrolase family protein [Candidatus Hydrogenedentota bacterium]
MIQSTLPLSRRNLFQAAALAAGAGVLAGRTGHAVAEKATLSLNGVILFQGDSITDAGRAKDNANPNDMNALGRGYAAMLASALLGAHPDKKLLCYNRGISGNKVPDLDARWQQDTIDLKPSVLSILIGVNDMWHVRSGKYDGTVKTYETGLNALLARTREALPDTALVICEPFILPCGAIDGTWQPEFDERRAVARAAAERAGAAWVPFQTVFDEAQSEETPAAYWAGDGVHPTMAGHALMARAWLDVTGLG